MCHLKHHTCIYCLESKPEADFNVEHVIPRAFGTFENNFTLQNTVCKSCNSHFSSALEIHLGRDTLEGKMRFDHGLKKPSELVHFGQERVSMKTAEGSFAGQNVYLTYSEEKGQLVVLPVPQVGFRKSDSSDYVYFNLKDVPPRNEIDTSYFDLNHPRAVRGSIGLSPDELRKTLNSFGYEFEIGGEEDFEPQEDVLCDVEYVIDKTIRRTIAKIAFNYFCHSAGREICTGSLFNSIRNFVRHDADEPYPLVRVSDAGILEDEKSADSRRRLGHIVTVDWAADKASIVSQVSILNYWSYHVCIARDVRGMINFTPAGHFFNIESRNILNLGCRTTVSV